VIFPLTVNSQKMEVDAEASTVLVDLLRDSLGLTGTHIGCDTSSCGACAVLLDGRPVKSCAVLAAQAIGREVETVESLDREGSLHPLQEAFADCHGLQCGYCTPGFLMTAIALLRASSTPSEDEIRASLAGHLCRCTGYAQIVEAIRTAAATLVKGSA
jgi:carbon-monoxide dehydrogenase small subunit